MSSGYFPASRFDEYGEQVLLCIKILEDLVSDWHDDRVYLTDDAEEYDLEYIERLNNAISALKQCVR